jgi:hypothetical protein
MTDELLQDLTIQVAEMAKSDLQNLGRVHGVLAISVKDEPLRRLTAFEKTIEERAGAGWLNSGQAKELVFSTLAFGAAMMPPDAILFASVINDWVGQPALLALPTERQKEIVRDPRKYPQYFVAHDALMSIGQSPERVCLFRQRLDENHRLVDEPRIDFIPQAEFDGRGKMFGVELNPQVVATAVRALKIHVDKNGAPAVN